MKNGEMEIAENSKKWNEILAVRLEVSFESSNTHELWAMQHDHVVMALERNRREVS